MVVHLSRCYKRSGNREKLSNKANGGCKLSSRMTRSGSIASLLTPRMSTTGHRMPIQAQRSDTRRLLSIVRFRVVFETEQGELTFDLIDNAKETIPRVLPEND